MPFYLCYTLGYTCPARNSGTTLNNVHAKRNSKKITIYVAEHIETNFVHSCELFTLVDIDSTVATATSI